MFTLPFVVPSYLGKKKKVDINKKFNIKNKYIFYPAQFWEHKNHIKLIEAFSILAKQNKEIKLVFCGSKKHYYKKVESYIYSKNLSKRILYIGRVRDDYMYSLYNNAELVVFPSLFGPTNIPPLEALYCNTPVICSGLFGMKNQLKKSSIYFNPNSARDIFSKMNLVLYDRKIRKNLISEGKRILRNYNQFHFTNLLKNYLNSMLK